MAKASRVRRTSVARVLLRLPADLHRTLTAAAASEGISFNEFCVRRLRDVPQTADSSALRPTVLEQAQRLFGDRLLGAIVIGSWARGEAVATSDIDVLLIIDSSTALTRELYGTWDQTPLEYEGRAVDVHFVHPSLAGTPPTALWCEAAVDGIVWYDRDGGITTRLAEIRRAIAEGRFVRRFTHGQPYWIGAA